jgi:hypothetical protein
MIYQTGKLPARPGSVSLKFSDAFNVAVLPTPPLIFGHASLVRTWGMLGNDKYGDCVCAGACHETKLYGAEGGTYIGFTTDDALRLYTQLTGFDPARLESDQGTDLQSAAAYRQKVGLLDARGIPHKIDAYAAVAKGNVEEHALAAYIFGAVGFGLALPSNAMNLFDAREPWDVATAGHATDNGHYVVITDRIANGNFIVITWGRAQEMTPAFLEAYNDESLVYLSREIIKNNVSPEGYNEALLNQYLKEV